ncbi:hypothetical protein BGX28_003095 [Mortierella sp. GBA30]|nr:hypothetical protein BGX28_003095 [Mortierella sp. GBA30]
MLFPVVEDLSIRQNRAFMNMAVRIVDWRAGQGSEAKRAQRAVPIQGNGWKGYWIPFQDQQQTTVSKFVPGKKSKHTMDYSFDIKEVPIGTGCDMIILSVHGGGFISGNALMFLDYFKKWMKSAQEHHNLQIGILSVEYSLSPESAYPVAMNEIIAAYRDLVTVHGVNPGLGDSAGGNICLGTSLKLRDSFSELGSPAGHILVSPWVRSSEPLQSSLFDVVSAVGCQIYAEAYTQNNPDIIMCPYTSPFHASTLAGLAPMLVFIGGVEILRPSTEQFLKRAQGDGVEVKTVVGEGRAHNYFLLDDISTKKDRETAYKEMSEFVFALHTKKQNSF